MQAISISMSERVQKAIRKMNSRWTYGSRSCCVRRSEIRFLEYGKEHVDARGNKRASTVEESAQRPQPAQFESKCSAQMHTRFVMAKKNFFSGELLQKLKQNGRQVCGHTAIRNCDCDCFKSSRGACLDRVACHRADSLEMYEYLCFELISLKY